MQDDSQLHIRRGASKSMDEETAVRELAQAILQPGIELAIFYCSPRYDLERLAQALRREFRDVPLIGCTTAGEITPTGYHNGSLTGVSIAGDALRARTARFDVAPFQAADGTAAAAKLLQEIGRQGTPVDRSNTFAFLLIDGLSMQEEMVASTVHHALHGVDMFGGSAGDDVRFAHTRIYHEGQFHEHVALLTLIQTDQQFHIFRSQHFVGSDCKLVITGADPARRIVHEINAEPAGVEFARLIGMEVAELTPLIFAAHPTVVSLGGEYFVRSIQKVNDDGSLTFFCAIDEGLVLTVARGKDMIDSLAATFADVAARIGPPQLVLGCDCILRRLELEQRDIKDKAAALMAANNTIGFATYGEQYNAMHVNQTFAGVAIGSRRRAS